MLPSIERIYKAVEAKKYTLTPTSPESDVLSYIEFRSKYAQSKWMTGFPAQAILQINHIFGTTAPTYVMPYSATAWILNQRPDLYDQFIGNPTRHWQHYATRMSGENSELRKWRAWACRAISESILPLEEFPIDEEQIKQEGIQIPSLELITSKIAELSSQEEVVLWQKELHN